MKKNNLNKYREKALWKRIVITSIIILSIIVMPFAIWSFKKPHFINVLILDKTVPDKSYREHKGLVWILNNLKYFNKNSEKAFDYNSDYYGFFPQENNKYKIKELPSNLENADLIYITDTYGVYKDDFYKNSQAGNRSDIIYGGLKLEEVKKIKSALNNNVIIGEFNTMASPTDVGARKEMEDIFNIQWSGWIGRYFTDLSKDNTEIPTWLIKDYEMQNLKKWKLKGPGFAFVKSDDTVVILEQDKDVGKNINTIEFANKAIKEFGVNNNIKYYYWFEIVKPGLGTEVLANYNIDVTENGKQVLKKYEINSSFPAIIRNKGKYTSYYFCGDFADNNKIPTFYNASGISFANKITAVDMEGMQNSFYWKVYYPLIEKILMDIVK